MVAVLAQVPMIFKAVQEGKHIKLQKEISLQRSHVITNETSSITLLISNFDAKDIEVAFVDTYISDNMVYL